MTCSFKNYMCGCQAFVLGESLRFTAEFEARSSRHAHTHSVTCVLKHSACRLPASSFLVKRSRRRRTTKKVHKKLPKKRSGCQICRFVSQGAKEASSFRYFSTSSEVIWVVCYCRFSRLCLKKKKTRGTSTAPLLYGTRGRRAVPPPPPATGEIAFKRLSAVET